MDAGFFSSSAPARLGDQFCITRPLRRYAMVVQSHELHDDFRSAVSADLWTLLAARGCHDRHLFVDRVSTRLLHRASAHALARCLAALGDHSILDEFPREDLCVDVYLAHRRSAE